MKKIPLQEGQSGTHEASEMQSLSGSSGAALEESQHGGLPWDTVVTALAGKLEAGPGLKTGKNRGEGRGKLEDE